MDRNSRQKNTQTKAAGKQLLRVIDAAAEYGGTVWMWRSLLWKRELPFVEIGRKYFLDRHDIEDYLQKNKRLA